MFPIIDIQELLNLRISTIVSKENKSHLITKHKVKCKYSKNGIDDC